MTIMERTSQLTKTHTNPDGSMVEVPADTIIGHDVTIGKNPTFDHGIRLEAWVVIGDNVALGHGTLVCYGAKVPDRVHVIPRGSQHIIIYGGARHLEVGQRIDHNVPSIGKIRECVVSALRM